MREREKERVCVREVVGERKREINRKKRIKISMNVAIRYRG